ncbi:phospholipase D-like domain-containing protein [Peribacillus frigoritolerans]|uniref:Phospholipase D family protein n=1 Tax=Peribacillus frigoritolerans TaxID=450367 RepID=A0AAJ1QQT0_9BACI|nr:phospholipase D family protein [Peribacillus frigoritolerans]MDM5286012.1 phospholipase D family protein [Peribacillus frigoritolerans]
MTVKTAIKGFLLVLLLYFLYVVVTTVVLFPKAEKEENRPIKQVSEYMGEKEATVDRVLLFEDGYESGLARMRMIQEAQHSIDIAYYAFGKGESTELFLGALIDAADRGVKVRILLDGISHGLRGQLSSARYALASHENIELRYYETFKPFKPWTWHNRLHDKIITVDGKLGIIGGRNIADKYLASKPPRNFVYDRDVLIFNAKEEKDSVIVEMKGYLNELWTHPYTSDVFSDLSKRQTEKGKRERDALAKKYSKALRTETDFVNPVVDWGKATTPTKKVSFIHNPIERFNKYPIVWRSLLDIAANANQSVYIQSPYIVPADALKEYVPKQLDSKANWTILTNSAASTPNMIAFSGYLAFRDSVVETGARLYEYSKPYSLHGKSVVYDQRLSAVGSYNLDSRSAFLNTESMVVIDSERFAAQLIGAMDSKIKNSTLIADNKKYIQPPEDQKKEESFFKATFLNALSKITVYLNRFI